MYLAVRLSGPAANEFAGMVIVAEPEVSAVELDVYAPLESTTEPLGVAAEPVTAIPTFKDWAVVMEPDAGVTVTIGVAVDEVTVTLPIPDALLYETTLALSGVYLAVRVSEPVASEPAAIVTVADPALSVAAEEA